VGTSTLSRWKDELAAWRIDPSVRAAAPEDPWACPVEAFRVEDGPPRPGDARTPSWRRAHECLPAGGAVLDVGCGGGAAALALVPPAARVVGVDESPDMLRAFADGARARGVAHREVPGRWPEVAPWTPTADVAVCRDVAYNVPDLDAFALALTGHAGHRVVLELGATHPLTWLGPLWRRFHGEDRPAGPSAGLARAVLADAGLTVHEERWTRPARPLAQEVRVRLTRRRLCLPLDREPEVAAALAETPAPQTRHVVTLWWEP